jgi:hypothetical protein
MKRLIELAGAIAAPVRMLLLGGVVAATLLPAAANASVVQFTCGGSPTGICYFTLFYSTGGSRNFTMRNGERDDLPGIRLGDSYCFDFNGIPRDGCLRHPIPAEHIRG